jgi:ABC-type molybdate transport system substrate-binding protein
VIWLMSQEKKHQQPDIDLDAEARLALSEARAMPPGPERSEAMKKAGILRNASAKHGIVWPKRGRPPKN